MELALIVYLISLLGPITSLLVTMALTTGLVSLAWWFFWTISHDFGGTVHTKWPTRWTIVTVVLASICAVIPTEKTAYLMVGAYATQKIAEAPKTQQLGAEVLKILELKIKHYAEEAEQEALKKLEKK